MPQIIVNTPPPPLEIDLSDDDLKVIHAATPTTAPTAPENDLTPLALNVISYADFVATVPPDSTKRSRQSRRFTLNLRNPLEYELSCWVDTLKQGRQYRAVMVNALRLFRDLKAGRLDVLFELFPWVRAEILQTLQPTQPDASEQLQRQLERLELLLLSPGNTGGPKPLTVPNGTKTPTPVAQDDSDLLKVKKAKPSGKSAQNFLDAAFAIAGIQ